MSNLQQKLTKEKSGFQDKTAKGELVVGSIIATIIAITPYLFQLWEGVPDTKTWDTFFGLYSSNYYDTVQVLMWTLLGKIVPFILLLLWMFTCRHWWYHALIVPIAMYTFQIVEVINDEVVFTEEVDFLFLLPILAVVIPSIYLIRAQMFNKITNADKSMEELEAEFKIKPKNFMGKLNDYF